MDVLDDMRTPSVFLITALSMPRSSCFNISRKSPTVFEIGFNAKTHNSFRLGRGTVTWGRPLMMLMSSILLITLAFGKTEALASDAEEDVEQN